MNNKFTNDQTNLEMSAAILQAIENVYSTSDNLCNRHAELREYYNIFLEKFKKDLSNTQKNNLDTLLSMGNDEDATYISYATICGMRAYSAFLNLINNPKSVIEYIQSRSISITEHYKFLD